MHLDVYGWVNASTGKLVNWRILVDLGREGPKRDLRGQLPGSMHGLTSLQLSAGAEGG